MGISCISQVQLPWGKLPGRGQVLPDMATYNQQCPSTNQSFITCEVTEPFTTLRLFLKAHRVEAAGPMFNNRTPCRAPFESAWRFGRHRQGWTFLWFIFIFLLSKVVFTILGVSRTHSWRAKVCINGWTFPLAALAKATGCQLAGVVCIAACYFNQTVGVWYDVFKESICGVGC